MADRIRVWVQAFRARPVLYLQWHDPDTGRRRTRSAGTADPTRAEHARADLEADLNHGRHRDAGRTTWKAFRLLFEGEYLTGLRGGTARLYANTLDAFGRLARPGKLGGVDARCLSRFVAALRKEPGRGGDRLAPSTIRLRLQHLHTALQWAEDQGLLPKVPKFPEVRVPRKKPQPVPVESWERLLAKAPDAQTRAYLLCGWLAGLRLSEAFRLRREPSEADPWVDWPRDRIVLPAEGVKGAADQWVPLDPELRDALEALPDRGPSLFHFTTRRGKPAALATVAGRVIRLAKLAGVRMSFKTLRRGFLCRYAARVPAQVLQKLGRHSDIRVTMDYYANIDEAVDEAVLGPRAGRKRPRKHAPEGGGLAPGGPDVTPCGDRAGRQ